jgi:peptidoglycan/xylan/chitin deacetylase (PgdA/CDA1 family)
LPLLVAEGIPCTYFVTARNVMTGAPFDHDLSRDQPLDPNTPDQLHELVRSGIEIGAHTRTHPDLGNIGDPVRLHDEVIAAREDLERLCGAHIRYFAFPFGQHVNLNSQVFRLARDADYDGVCSAYGGYNFPGDDAFHLQRIHVHDDLVALKNWTSVDPRKVRSVRRYAYQRWCPERIEPTGASA